MKTKLNLLLLIVLIGIQALGQSNNLKTYKEARVNLKKIDTTVIGDIKKRDINNHRAKVPGTVLFSEDFANQIPVGWTVTNQAGGNNNWIWSNTAPGGQYSLSVAAINSTTASNGFMSLPSGFFNTPFPVGGPVAMDTWLSSPAITIPSTLSVFLQWEQSSRYCCSNSDELVVEVSSDGINWAIYDATLGRGPNAANPIPSSDPAEVVRINVSAQLANQTTAYLRWRQTGASHYYWMIDDVMLVEGLANGMTLSDSKINFSDTTINPVFSIVPQLLLNPLTFTGSIINSGGHTQTGVGLEVEVVQDSTYDGLAGIGTVDIKATMLGIPVPSLQANTINAGPYINTGDGFYTAYFRVLSTAQNQNPSAALSSQQFIISDTILGKDTGPYMGSAGTANYINGGNDGDRWASLMTIGANSKTNGNVLATSISILVANTLTNVGAIIQPRVWYWDDAASTVNNAITSPPVGLSNISTTIDSTMLGKWITLPLFPPASLATNAQYAVGWEQVGGASSGATFAAARDRGRESMQPSVSNFVYINHGGPSWGWVNQLAAVRLNFGNLLIGIDNNQDSVTDFSVVPNPNSGQFKIQIAPNQAKTYALSVRNMMGQIVCTDIIRAVGLTSKKVDIPDTGRGVFLVMLEDDTEKIVKKIIVK